ncbi:HmuY family protein [Algoriphagus sediminis]|uniref:HmuY family protein n=1 Tax=Algoriphagus sediminis TaxID=3057113 RepID=A0ABT7YF82_9BACT|nr:HmuY family protein [Algoriphagus sediminis]MDN3205188.1 HmuY family protein [Algoriphagus sediminis]
MKTSIKQLAISALALTLFTACSEGDDPLPIVPVETQMVQDFEAPNDVIDRTTGTIVEERPFQYFSLEQNAQVSEGDDWDLAFKGTTIRVNATKNVSAAIVTGIFDQIDSVPADASFASDTETELAIPTGGGNGWYNYNPALNTITPIPGRVILVKTTEGNFVKMEILSYYKGNPPVAEIDPFTTPSAHYTFRFALQPNGSTEF